MSNTMSMLHCAARAPDPRPTLQVSSASSMPSRRALGDSPTVGGLSATGARATFAEPPRRATQGPVTIPRRPSAYQSLTSEAGGQPKGVVFGEDVGVKGGVHCVTEESAKASLAPPCFDTSLSERGHRWARCRHGGLGSHACGGNTVPEIRRPGDGATQQLRAMRWLTHNQFAAPIVVRMPGGFGKDVGDPWHSLSSEVTWAHAIGWQVLVPSNAADAVGLLRTAMRSRNPSIFSNTDRCS